ncbi:MAG: macro domain-containing protein [Lachnospiraceae bacterium]|nr:macro domain-containing protein [Lachnospiraceae bacterium]
MADVDSCGCKGVFAVITYVKGDIFTSPAKILVNTVNTEGVMGKGIALELKKRYPEMFQAYKKKCADQKLDVGTLMMWKKSDKWILLFPTKRQWRRPSKMEYIEKGLQRFADNWDKLGANSIAFPKLGCGNGGLNWDEVRPLMESYLGKIPMQVYIYVDNYQDPKPEHLDITEMEKWLSGEVGLEGYEKFSFKLKELLHKNNGVFLQDSHKCSLDEKDGFICIDDINIDEKTVCDFWNYVRDVGVVSENEIPVEYRGFSEGFMGILKKLGYVTGVIIAKDGKTFASVPNGYQYIAD